MLFPNDLKQVYPEYNSIPNITKICNLKPDVSLVNRDNTCFKFNFKEQLSCKNIKCHF